MRKRILSLLTILALSCMFTSSVSAYADRSRVLPLEVSGSTVEDYSLSNGVAVQTDAVHVLYNVGFYVLYVTEAKAGGAGDVDIYAEYSDDGETWDRTYISDMAGTITVEGTIVDALQDATRRIVFTARLGNYVRIVFDPDADSEVTAHLVYLEYR